MFAKREWMVGSFTLLVVTMLLQLPHGGLRKCVAATARGEAPRVIQTFGTLSAHGARLLGSH